VNKKVVSLCQLAFRAGKVSYGSRLIPSIQTRQAKLVCLSPFCGKNRTKKLHDKCAFYHIPCLTLADWDAISKKSIQSFAILDEGFAQAILEEMKG
jgi:ribosomal protein L7Ae-like RNA K-turn-binding protein